jgi:hypothetical protein
MKRLVEREFPSGTVEANVAEFLTNVEPFQSPVGAKQRVRARLLEGPVRGRRPWLLRPVAVGGLLMFVAVASAAAWRSQHKRHAPDMIVPRPELAPVVAAPIPSSEASEQSPVISYELPPAPQPLVRSLPEPQPSPAHRPDSSAAAEAGVLFEATGALRRDGDAARASRILDDYFRRFPHGALTEEALALSIDAASARGDARARTLAKRYLEQFPKGNFRTKAERVLSRMGE